MSQMRRNTMTEEPQETPEIVHVLDEEQLDDIAGGDGGQPSYPPYV